MKNFAAVRPLRPAWQTALLAGLTAAAIAASGVGLTGYKAIGVFGWDSWALLVVAFALAIGGSTWAAAQWMSPTGKSGFWLPVLGIILAVAGLALGAVSGNYVPALAGMCLRFGAIYSFATALLMVVIFRRTAPILRQRVAVAAGVLAGFTGFLVLQLHCPINEFWHVLTGHALLPVIWGLIGYLGIRLAFR